MSKNILILGAGASKECGAPLIDDFLDMAEDLLDFKKIDEEYIEDFKNIFEMIKTFKPIHYSIKIDLENIENLFAAIEMARLLKNIEGITESKIQSMITSIRRFIFITLEKSIKMPVKGKQVFPCSTYDRLVQLLKKIHDKKPEETFSIITFNYDLALDYALYFYNDIINYGLDENIGNRFPLYLKLHGSMNWVKCPKCNKIHNWSIKDFFTKYNYMFLEDTKEVILDLATKLKKSGINCCDKELESEPFIIPPIWNKTEYYKDIDKVWQMAAKELSKAENIFICGYSLRESDLFFRYLFGLSTIETIRIRRLWVFDPDQLNIVKDRYESFLGSGVKRNFRFFKEKFSTAISTIETLYS